MKEEHFATLRRHMIEVIGIYVDLAGDDLGKSSLDNRLLAAMGRVPRHAFVPPPPLARHAYQDMPLPIGFGKTISPPFMVAIMTDLLEPRPEDVVLEVGTGLGYIKRRFLVSSFARYGASRLSRSSLSEPRSFCGSSATTTSGFALAMALWAGRSMRLTTRSSSRRAPSWCRRP
jgi:hypothetical protein